MSDTPENFGAANVGDSSPTEEFRPTPLKSKLRANAGAFIPKRFQAATPEAETPPPAASWEESADVPAVPALDNVPVTDENPVVEAEPPKNEDEGSSSLSSSAASSVATQQPAPAQQEEEEEKEEEPVVNKGGDDDAQAVDTFDYVPWDAREHLNLVFIGHVDAGKSTIAGNILFLTGQVDQRTIEKYEREAKEKAGGSWYLAFIMDTNEDERQKGKTVEVGRAHFETAARRYTVLDAPGHKNYVPNMIGGATQADVGLLVISARKSEFEAGFDRGGQTREHTVLAKTLGVKRLVVLINKMDEKTVEWSQSRYDEIQKKLVPFFKSVGFRASDAIFLPVSGIIGANIMERISPDVCPWYTGPTLMEILDTLPLPKRDAEAPLRIPVLDRMRDAGKTVIQGKVESGRIHVGQRVILMPNRQIGIVKDLGTDIQEITWAGPGENIRFSVSGVSEDNVRTGFVICDIARPIVPVSQFEAQVMVIGLLDHKPIFSPGYSAVIHVHTAAEECTVKLILAELDKKTAQPTKKRPKFVTSGAIVQARIALSQPMCVDTFKDCPQLGRFTLRDEGKTIAIGTITRLPQARKPESKSA